ncbi:MAG: dihydroorotate dehydrogenase electron transfer subunit [Candidatus Omnitrophica bacterium]|nr:dihydroorotate dehydrogenase electron transfer subunit [Candidatus Omnitrophota bacterium]
MLYDLKAKIEKNQQLSASVYYLELSMPKIPAKLKPGHFVHIRLMHTNDPLLRRPLSVNRIVERKLKNKIIRNIGIVYKIVGKGTNLLKEMAAGEQVDVLGPLGNGFELACLKPKQPIILVSGGMGIAPLVFLAQTLSKAIPEKQITAFLGMDTKKNLILADNLKKLGCAVHISTDDGSQGFKGYVSELLEKKLLKLKPNELNPYIYACGPKPMLKAVGMVAAKFNLSGQVSLDEMMGCGIGACLGCVIKTVDLKKQQPFVYKRICKDGPVFGINEILWEE